MMQRFVTNGWVVVPKLLGRGEISQLQTSIVDVVQGLSDTKIAGGVNDVLAVHHPHKRSSVIHDFLSYPPIVDVLNTVVGPNVKCMQSMYFVKGPNMPGQAWHQDEFYIPTRDRSLVGVWMALDDATVDNGCLWVHSGSHKKGVLYEQRMQNDQRFDPTGECVGFPYEREGGTPVEVNAGDVVFFHGYLLHRSLNNVTQSYFRRALVAHYMSAESLLPWDMDGTIDKTDDNRDIVLVSGVDPYAYKGIQNHAKCFFRPVTGRGTLGKGAAAIGK